MSQKVGKVQTGEESAQKIKFGLFHIFPKLKKVQNILGEGVKKIVDFFQFLGHFLINMLPLVHLIIVILVSAPYYCKSCTKNYCDNCKCTKLLW